MKLVSRLQLIAALVAALASGSLLADGSLSADGSLPADGSTTTEHTVSEQLDSWTPYSYYSSSDLASEQSARVIPLYAGDFNSGYSADTDALSIGLEDGSEGLWKFSLDLNKSNESLFSEEQYRLNAAYSPDGNNSKFYINYGNRRVPVSIKVDDFLDYNQAGYSGSDLALGFEQNVNDSWAVSISYAKSELEQVASDSSVLGLEQGLATNQKYWFDLNKDGLPEAVNLFSELGLSTNFDKAYEGIEIRLTRQVSDDLRIGAALNQTRSQFDWQPYQLNDLETTKSELDEERFSLFSQIDFTPEWSADAQLSHQYYKQSSPQIVSLVTADADELSFDSTTLDIGVQYQGRWDDMGLVIRIDLVNLLGTDSRQGLIGQDVNETDLAPYTFQTPKYIKLSGSINF